MKALLCVMGLVLALNTSVASASELKTEKYSIVTVSSGESVSFSITLDTLVDSCNSYGLYSELNVISKNYKGGKLIEVSTFSDQTVAGCSNNRMRKATLEEGKKYVTKQGETVRLLLPAVVGVKIVE